MTTPVTPKELATTLKELVPVVDRLRQMLGAARHAFNRHSLAKLAEIAQLWDDTILDLDPYFEKVEEELRQAPEAAKANLAKLKGILTQLELLGERITKLADPIRRKSNHGAIFGDQEFFQINDLFAQFAGLLRALADFLAHQDASLKAYILQECKKVRGICFSEENFHATQMMDSPGQQGAWSIYLEMLDRFREIMGHLLEIVNLIE